MKIKSNPVSEIQAICNTVLARLDSAKDSFDWEVIRGQLQTATYIAKQAKIEADRKF